MAARVLLLFGFDDALACTPGGPVKLVPARDKAAQGAIGCACYEPICGLSLSLW